MLRLFIFELFKELRQFAQNYGLCSAKDHIFTVVVQTFKFLNDRFSCNLRTTNSPSPDNTGCKSQIYQNFQKETESKIHNLKEDEPMIESTESMRVNEIDDSLTPERDEDDVEPEMEQNGTDDGKLFIFLKRDWT